MHQSPPTRSTIDHASSRTSDEAPYIYIASPWMPVDGGGMFRVVDNLIRSQTDRVPAEAARLRPLDTRGKGRAVFSLWVLLVAIAKIAVGRLQGNLAGVHVNMALRMSLFRKGTLIAVCAALGVPTVLHLHAQMHGFYASLPAVLRRLTRWVFSLPEAVIVIGPAAKTFVTEVLGVPAEKVRMINNGVPGPDEPPKPGPLDARQRVLFLGVLSPLKGLPDLLRALAEPALDTTNMQVTVAGGGDVAEYQAMARALGVDGFVQFEGWCDRQKVRRLLANSDLLVLPSHDEVLPMAVLEALAHGVPVVTTAVGEIPSVLTDGVDAIFVTPGDAASIAAGIQRVLQEPGLRQLLAENGRAVYLRDFSLPGFFSNVAAVHRRHFGVAAHLNETPSPAQRASGLTEP